jgi:hypothetical protein
MFGSSGSPASLLIVDFHPETGRFGPRGDLQMSTLAQLALAATGRDTEGEPLNAPVWRQRHQRSPIGRFRIYVASVSPCYSLPAVSKIRFTRHLLRMMARLRIRLRSPHKSPCVPLRRRRRGRRLDADQRDLSHATNASGIRPAGSLPAGAFYFGARVHFWLLVPRGVHFALAVIFHMSSSDTV